ncbi:MAG: hypothetical protein IJ217_01040 [Clostridia bacterium]|nr:hypothetical protein [Clostridia bacterium]
MEKVWIFLILSSFGVAIWQGNLEGVVKALFDSTNSAIELCVGIAGILCMWSGFMKIAERSGFVSLLSKIVRPLIKLLFPDVANEPEISGQIGMNIAANMLGLGNVATPTGIKAIEKLQERNKNKERLSNAMLMLVVLNTASIQLIPTTVIALRANYGSANPTSIVLPTIVSSVVSVIVGIILVKVVSKKERE